MTKRNPHLAKLTAGYLFPEINKRKQAFIQRNPNVKLISLGIGDTTYPLPPTVIEGLQNFTKGLGTFAGYSGYGPEQGMPQLREKIAQKYYRNQVAADEIFISDGAKCDIGRMQYLFGEDTRVAVQNPTYPVYVDTAVMLGKTGFYNPLEDQYSGIIYMPCTPENDFFPCLEEIARPDIIYFCSPNNPTGSVATREQLAKLVNFAKNNRSIIIFDAAYAVYIQDPSLPKSIYEIEGAREVAIEINSFSKMAGFTGVRLGWSVVPAELQFEGGHPVRKDWERIHTTCFNGASNIAQYGGLIVLEEMQSAVSDMVDVYLENAKIIKQGCEHLGFSSYGGIHAPYIWVEFPERKSWDIFEEILENVGVVTTPGSGFGSAGEGFLRFSAFGRREGTLEAMERITNHFNVKVARPSRPGKSSQAVPAWLP